MPLYLLCLTCSHQWRRWRPFKNKTWAMEGGSTVTFKVTVYFQLISWQCVRSILCLGLDTFVWWHLWVLVGVSVEMVRFFFLYGIRCNAKSTWLVRKMLLVIMLLNVCGDTLLWVYLVWRLLQTSLLPQFISCLNYSWGWLVLFLALNCSRLNDLDWKI